MSRYREMGKVVDVFAGVEDHGCLTVTVGIDFEPSHQAFGCLIFDSKERQGDFIADLCRVFEVSGLELLVGLPVVALRCFDVNNEPIEALETAAGKRFVLTEWRRKHWPEAKDPLATRVERFYREDAFLRRRLGENMDDMERAHAGYRAVEQRT